MSEGNNEKKCWMVRAGKGGILFEDFRGNKYVSVGWEKAGDLTAVNTREDIRRILGRCYPEYNTFKIGQTAGTLLRFCSEISVGDRVVTYNPATRGYLRGEITGKYQFTGTPDDNAHRMGVKWDEELVSRDALGAVAKNALGALQTIFEIPAYAAGEIFRDSDAATPDIQASLDAREAEEQAEEIEASGENRAEDALERVKDKIMALDWLPMQHLVAAILRAMGNKTTVAGHGIQGMDVVASSNLLILGGHRIVAEVKHHRGKTMGVDEVRQFRGAMSDGDRGLFVSTGGFTQQAQAEMRTRPLVELVDLDKLARLVVEHYDNFDPEGRALLPLVKIYWPM